MFRGADDPNFPWTGILLGYPINAMWYWCTDQVRSYPVPHTSIAFKCLNCIIDSAPQVIVQRVLAADNIESARSGTSDRQVALDGGLTIITFHTTIRNYPRRIS